MRFYKFSNKDKYLSGLNREINCVIGDASFPQFINPSTTYVWDVIVPDTSTLSYNNNSMSGPIHIDVVELHNKREISEMEEWKDEQVLLSALERNGSIISHFPAASLEMQLAAMKEYHGNYNFIRHPHYAAADYYRLAIRQHYSTNYSYPITPYTLLGDMNIPGGVEHSCTIQ